MFRDWISVRMGYCAIKTWRNNVMALCQSLGFFRSAAGIAFSMHSTCFSKPLKRALVSSIRLLVGYWLVAAAVLEPEPLLTVVNTTKELWRIEWGYRDLKCDDDLRKSA